MQSQRSFKSGKIAFITFLCLVGITLIVGAFKFCIRTPVVPSVFTDTSSSNFDENTEKWGQLGISEQYPQVLVGGVPYTSRAHKISIEQIGTHLYDVEMTQTDENEKLHTINAEIYEIKSISTNCAVAIHYEDYDGFYVFVNPVYQPGTLGDLIESLNLKETMTIGNVYYSGYRNGEYVQVEYSLDNISEIVWELLLSDPTVPSTQEREYGEEWLAVSISLSDFGYENIALSITRDGYLQTNVLETGKIFYIGEEKTKAFAEYIYRNADSRQLSLGSDTLNKSLSSYYQENSEE